MKETVHKRLYGQGSAGNELTKELIGLTHKWKNAKPEHCELVDRVEGAATLLRDFAGAAYACLCTVVRATQTQEKVFSNFVFNSQGSNMWKLLIDEELAVRFTTETSFRVETTKPKAQTEAPKANLLVAQYLTGSLFTQSQSADLLMPSIPQPLPVPEPMQIDTAEDQLEMDVLNSLPIMKPLLYVLDRLHKLGIPAGPMPQWMQMLHGDLSNPACSLPARLFIIKLVLNRPDIFQPWAVDWFEPIAKTMGCNENGGVGFHYFLRDVATLFATTWENCVPIGKTQICTKFVNYLVRVGADTRRQILLSNIDIIGALMRKWREMLTIEHKFVEIMLKKTGKEEKEVVAWRLAGVQFYALAVTHGIAILENAVPKPQVLHEALIKCLDFAKRQVQLAAAEVIGKALAAGAPGDLKDQLVVYLQHKDLHEMGILVQLLDRMTLHYPELLDVTALVLKLANIFPALNGGHRALLLHSTRRYFECVAGSPELRNASELTEYIRRDLDKIVNDEDESHRQALTQLLCACVPLLHSPSIRRLLIDVMKLHIRTLTQFGTVEIRRLAFQLARQVYDLSDRLGVEGEICRAAAQSVLVKALSDADTEIQETAAGFWHDKDRLAVEPCMRLEQTLSRLYTPGEEEVWLPAAAYLLLRLCEGAADYGRLLFDRPLYQCEFRPLQVTTQATPVQWTATNTRLDEHYEGLMTPALPSQEMTLLVGVMQSQTGANQTAFVMPKAPSAIEAKRARYLPEGTAYLQEERREQMKQRQMERIQQRAKEARLKQAQVLRSYWSGDVPNTQIQHKDLLLPLAWLCRTDHDMAGLLWVLLLSALYKAEQSGQLRTRILEGLCSVLRISEKWSPAVISAVHRSAIEIVRISPQLVNKVDPRLVARSGIRAYCFQSAILLLQECILRLGPPDAPVSRDSRDYWLGLAKVYSRLGEVESARGVWRRLTNSAETLGLRMALDAKAQGRLKEAKTAFAELRQQPLDPAFQAEVQAEYLECLTELGSWKDLHDELGHDLSDLRLKSMLRQDMYGQLSDVMGALPTAQLVRRYPYESSLLSIAQDDADRARYYVDELFKRFVERWQSLNELSVYAKHQLVQQLQLLFDCIQYLKLAQPHKEEGRDEYTTRVETALLDWTQRCPSLHHDSVQVWEEVAYARVLFYDQLMRKHNLKLNKVKDFASEMYAGAAQCPLKLGKLEQTEMLLRIAVNKRADAQVTNIPLFRSIIKLRAKQYGGNLTERIGELLQVIDAQKVDEGKEAELELIKGYLHQKHVKLALGADVASLLEPAKLAFQHLERAHALKQDQESGLKLAKLCDVVLRAMETERPEQLQVLYPAINQANLQPERLARSIVVSALKAMSAGSEKAHSLFPRVLELIRYPTALGAARPLFKDIPAWMCIRWIAQVLAIIDQPESEALVPLLKRLVARYPQAIYYPYKCFISVESPLQYDRVVNPEKSKAWETLEQGLAPYGFLDAFVEALECLTNPEHRFQYWYGALKDHLEVPGRNEHFLMHWGAEMHNNLAATDRRFLGKDIGAYNAKFAERWKSQFQAILGENGASILNASLAQLQALAKEIATTSIGHGHEALSTFSEWLAKYDITEHATHEIDLPGQYSGLREPMVHATVKCVSFDQSILILESLRRPKRLGVHGSDEKEYLLLVKGGEDLRLDQRVEQLFNLMNLIFKQDPECAKANIHLKTFQVVPLSKRLGVLEWVQNTEPLKALITRELNRYTGISDLYSTEGSKHRIHWINSISGGHQIQENHVLALYKSGEEIVPRFREHEEKVEWDLVRRGLLALAATQESFVGIRSEFMKSLAVVGVCGYMLGIGDRHLDNFLVDRSDGGLLAIDFGYSFGTAVHLGVPELMPFRLTRQLRSVLAPEGVDGEFRHTVVSCLRALRKQRHVLLDCSEVFIKEPLLDWQKQAQVRELVASDTYQSQVESFAWYPKKKLAAVRMKLEGANPAHVLLAELAETRHANQPYYSRIAEAVLGARDALRRRLPAQGLSPEQQADCLIEHATDPNILGRTWIGWLPHI